MKDILSQLLGDYKKAGTTKEQQDQYRRFIEESKVVIRASMDKVKGASPGRARELLEVQAWLRQNMRDASATSHVSILEMVYLTGAIFEQTMEIASEFFRKNGGFGDLDEKLKTQSLIDSVKGTGTIGEC